MTFFPPPRSGGGAAFSLHIIIEALRICDRLAPTSRRKGAAVGICSLACHSVCVVRTPPPPSVPSSGALQGAFCIHTCAHYPKWEGGWYVGGARKQVK